MQKEMKMSENSLIILGSLGIFAFVTISVIALVYDRGVKLKASGDAVEFQTEIKSSNISTGDAIVLTKKTEDSRTDGSGMEQ